MQLLNTLSLFLAFALSALAITITSPQTTNQKVDFSKPFTVRWNSVPSDADEFTITLVNMAGHNVNKDLAKDVDSSKGEYRVERVADIPIGNNYQINFRSTAKDNLGILAQSSMFNVTKVAEKEKEETRPKANATNTATEAAPTETDNGAAGNVNGVLTGSVIAGVMGLAVLVL